MKLHAWNMTEYERLVYLDADALVLQNTDHLFTELYMPTRWHLASVLIPMPKTNLTLSGFFVIQPDELVFQTLLSGRRAGAPDRSRVYWLHRRWILSRHTSRETVRRRAPYAGNLNCSVS